MKKLTWGILIFVLVILFIFSWVVAGLFSLGGSTDFGNVAVIPVNGVILVGNSAGVFGEQVASSTEIVNFIKEADADPSIDAILFDINSPGGSAVASQEIALAIKKSNKPSVAVIREVGASGGYWVASATDRIFVNEMSITGSIGVLASYVEFNGLLSRYNMTYQRLVGGKYKDMGSPLKELSFDERVLLQKKIDRIHDLFILDISKNRGMSVPELKKLATGEFFLGVEAVENGLVDQVGDRDSAASYLEGVLDKSVDFVEYRQPPSFLDLIAGVLSEPSFLLGQGIGSALSYEQDFVLRT